MGRIPLISQSYQGKSLIASGQECVNLYAELNAGTPGDPQAPVPMTHYPTPGTVLYANPNNATKVRCLYRTSIGGAYAVVGNRVYYILNDASMVQVGTIEDRPTQCYMIDNGQVVVLVDGSPTGYAIDMNSNEFAPIIDPSFYGADFVVFLDTFFVFNRPNTNQFYISLSNVSYGMLSGTGIASGTIVAGAGYTDGTYDNVPLTGGSGTGATASIVVAGGVVTVVSPENYGQNYVVGDVLSANAADIGGTGAGFTFTMTAFALAFDPLDIAAKAGFSDPIVGIATVHRELWLIGNLTTEVWIGTGAADFYFQQVQGAFINHGCAAQYSIANQDISVFFLMQDQQGVGLVVRGTGYEIEEISTPRIVSEFKSYITLNDAVGFCFQIEDHAYYAVVFPIANKGWLYDLTTKMWSEWNWTDANGVLNRPRANCCMFAYNNNIIGDWENGKLLKLDINVFTDEGNPITRIKTFPHIMDDNYSRLTYNSFDADIECGTTEDLEDDPQISLSWSDDRGKTYGNAIAQSMGKTGQYLTTVSWNRLGMARDRVFKVTWSAPVKTAINGGFIELKKART